MLDLVKKNSIVFSILLSTSSCVGYYLYNRKLQDDKRASKTIYIKVFLTILALTYGLIYIIGNNSKSSNNNKSIFDFVPKFSKSKSENVLKDTKKTISSDFIEKIDVKKEITNDVKSSENKEMSNPTPNANNNQVNQQTKITNDNVSTSPQLSTLKNQTSNVEKFLTGNPNF